MIKKPGQRMRRRDPFIHGVSLLSRQAYKTVEIVNNMLVACIKQAMTQGGYVSWGGVGRFFVMTTTPGQRVNPKTRAPVITKTGTRRVRLRASVLLRREVPPL